jgi:hypothetical protein
MYKVSRRPSDAQRRILHQTCRGCLRENHFDDAESRQLHNKTEQELIAGNWFALAPCRRSEMGIVCDHPHENLSSVMTRRGFSRS